ncbi:MAG TPA: 16S rRNA (cytosine(1402)-N(4))-methyltransferase RsmH, partial [Polyangiaceae bacterium]
MSAQLALPGLAEDFASDRVEWVWSEDEEEVNVVEHFVHATVMRDEVVQALAPRAGGIYVDATLGGGGHTEGILEAEPNARVIAFDKDAIAIAAAKHRLERFEERVDIVHAPFANIEQELARLGISRVSGICADLGVSSPQLDDPLRGMSFRREGPIDMRMDAESGETALEMIARMDDDELANVIYNYGDERRSRRIARSIHRALEAGELETTLDLRRAIVRAVGPVRVGGVDPATRTFQALRIAVNGELSELETLLAALPKIVEVGGAAAILTFHSLEDRPVKQAF